MMYVADHLPAHFHAEYSGEEAMILVESGDIYRGSLPARAGRLVKEWAVMHRHELEENWRRAQLEQPHRTLVTPMKYFNRIKEFELLANYCVRLHFADEYVGEIDLAPLFAKPHGPLTETFSDRNFFQKAFLDHGTLSWPNGYDICSDILRYYCERGQVTSREELDAYFAEEAPTPSFKEEKP